MTLLLLVVLPSVVALVLVMALGLSVMWRTLAGERWQVPLQREALADPALELLWSRSAQERVQATQVMLQPVPVPSAS